MKDLFTNTFHLVVKLTPLKAIKALFISKGQWPLKMQLPEGVELGT